MKHTSKKLLAIVMTIVTLLGIIVIPNEARAFEEFLVETVKDDVPLWSEPRKASTKVRVVEEKGTLFLVKAQVENEHNHTWFLLENRNWVYSENVRRHDHQSTMCGVPEKKYSCIDEKRHSISTTDFDLCDCGYRLNERYSNTSENHNFENGDGICLDCGYIFTRSFEDCDFFIRLGENCYTYSGPTKHSKKYDKQLFKNEDLRVIKKAKNEFNNEWFQLEKDGSWLFSGHVTHIHQDVMSTPFPTDTKYDQKDGSVHIASKTYDNLCNCNFKTGSYTEVEEENHDFNTDLICEKCGYKSVVSTATTTTTTEAAEVTTTAPAIDTSHFYVDTEIKTGCSSTSYERGELISSTIDKGNMKHHYIVDIYEKTCASCGGLVSEGHKNNDNTSKHITEKTAVDHHFLTNDLGQEYCDICDFNVALFLAENEIMLLKVQIALSIVGQLPYLGEGADIIDGLIAFSHGDIADGLLSFSAAVPFSGNAPGTASIINKAIDYNKSSERLKGLSKLANKTDIKMSDIFDSSDIYFSNFNNYKKVMGTAPEGFHIHHLVEQSQVNRAGFKAELVYSTANSIIIDAETHYKITRFYNSSFQGYASFRDYITTLPFEQQYQLGLQVLQTFDVIT